jgi:hypothetical protein
MNSTVKVYRFRKYDIASDAFKVSARMATRTCINRISGLPIKGTELKTNSANVDGDGMTEIGFSIGTSIPKRRPTGVDEGVGPMFARSGQK